MTTASDPFLRAAGRWCIVGAVIGAIGGLVTAFYPAAVGTDRWSYPYTPAGYVIAEASFVVNHILLLLGLVGLVRSGAAGTRLPGRVGVGAAIVGMVALTVCELIAMTLADEAYPTARTDRLDAGYGVSSMLLGVGLVLAGIAVIRTRLWTGWRRYPVLACGAGLFVFALPGLASGSFLAARLGITAWVLLWITVGLALTRPARAGDPAARIAATV